MQFLKRFKPLCSPFLFVVLLIVSLFYYFPANPVEGNGRSWFLRSQPNSREYKELARVLKKASMPDRTVILTTVNQEWASPGSVIDLFLESFRIGEGTEGLLNHLVIVAMDGNAFHRCTLIHLHCFYLTTPASTTSDYLKFMWRRIDFSRMVLELGYSFVFTDADIMWLRNPFAHFTPNEGMTVACNFYTGNPNDKSNRVDGGFKYVKSNDIMIEFYKYWYMSRILYPNFDDQSVFEIIKHDHTVNTMGMQMKYLDNAYFGGFCNPSKDMNKVCTMHSNCCVGIERKLHDLRLVLDDWRNYISLSPREMRLKGFSSSSSSWRAPSRCKW